MYKTIISDYNGFNRTIELVKQTFDKITKTVINECILEHSIDGVLVPELNKLIILKADNNQTVPISETETMNDFDYIELQEELGVPTKTIFESIIQYCDLIGRINSKANYQF